MQTWLVEKPEDSDGSHEVWNEWKAYCLTRSQKIFTQRNQWFNFSKEDISKNLGSFTNVPEIFFISNEKDDCCFSDAVSKIGLEITHDVSVAIKLLRGHSSKEVKILSFPDWPNSCFDLLHKSHFTIGEVDKWSLSAPFLIEQSLATEAEPIPLDFKVYYRCGLPVTVLVMDRNGQKTRLSYLSAQDWSYIPWSDVFIYPYFKDWEEGGCPSDKIILRAKTAVSNSKKIIPLVNASDLFVSLDMFVPVNKPDIAWLGEITPRPGAIHANKLTTKFIRQLLFE
ncbi:MAG: hypothetical protein HLUCCX21_03555 [Porphyrobacter sp. HL-46]|nr:MAG: hypothetical protein HLUCCX21_03555 [Porphyrobacter sp. HL-46]